MTSGPPQTGSPAGEGQADGGLPSDAEPDDDDLDDETRTVRLRRRGGQPSEPATDDIDADDGSTVVVRRESKRRAEAAAAAGAGDEEPDPITVVSRSRIRRAASEVPTPSGPTEAIDEPPLTYPPRTSEPVIVPRMPAVLRHPQQPVDTAAIDAERLRRARRRLIGAVVAASALAVAAVTGLVLLLTAF